MRRPRSEPRPSLAAFTEWLLRSGRLARLWALWAVAVLLLAALAVLRDGPAGTPATPATVVVLALKVAALALLGAAVHSLVADYLPGAWRSGPPERKQK